VRICLFAYQKVSARNAALGASRFPAANASVSPLHARSSATLRFWLLDEATSALDAESEKVAQAALTKAASSGDRITIAVVHRLSTIKDANLICVFLVGKIVEAGTHSELLEKDQLYAKTRQAQSLDLAV
jgi:ABC-type transport system involved in cytochrome bd biosynthesis fused ATPase/permease subunit